MTFNHMTPLDLETVKIIYAETNSLKKAAQILGCGRSKLQEFCAKNNITYVTLYNHNAFSTITNENSYWAGFLAADGCVYKNRIMSALQIRDKEQLKNLYTFIGHEREPVINGEYAQFCFGSKQTTIDLLKNFNITPKKSLTLQPPNLITEEQKRNFIRGYSDGDGCLYWSDKNNYGNFSIVGGSYKIIEWIRNVILFNLKINVNITNKNEKYFTISYSGKNGIFVLEWLYQNSDGFRMARKYEKFLYMKSKQQEKKLKKETVKKEVLEMRNLYLSGLIYQEIADKLGIKYDRVFYYLSQDKTLKKFRGPRKKS